MEIDSAMPNWKRIWQLTSGIHYETPEKTVLEELLNVSNELQNGLLQFQSAKLSTIKLEDVLGERLDNKILPFMQRLQDSLDLDTRQCWRLFCSYLENEYRGSTSSFIAIISIEQNIKKLIDDIIRYYTLLRMIILKILKNLLIFYNASSHPYCKQYTIFVDKISLRKLCDSHIKQLEYLLNEQSPNKLVTCENFLYQSKHISWSERNAREIIETLQILLLISEHYPMNYKYLLQLFACFKSHSFGKQQQYFDCSYQLHADLITRMTYLEILIFLKCISCDCKELETLFLNQHFQKLDEEIARMYHNPEHGPLLLGWMIFNLHCNGDYLKIEHTYHRYQQFGQRAISLNCFQYMHQLLCNLMFQDDCLVSRIARNTIHNLLTIICELFDDTCSRFPFIYELLCELLSWPTLAKSFCTKDVGGVRLLYNSLLETFPYNFALVSELASALSKAGMEKYIKPLLEKLPILMDYYSDKKYILKPKMNSENEYILMQSVKPFPSIDFSIPVGTIASLSSRQIGTCIHFQISVNYFNVLCHEIFCLLSETTYIHTKVETKNRMRNVEAGLEYMHFMLIRTSNISNISAELVRPIELCVDLINKFKTLQNPPVKLLSNCLNICTALLPLAEEEIYTRIINLNILPVVTNTCLNDYKKYAHGFFFDSRLVGSVLVDVEKKLERYDFFFSYLKFLRTYTKLQRNNLLQIELPGLVLLLHEVFPHIQTWHFKIEDDRNKIYAEVMAFLCDILDTATRVSERSDKDSVNKQILHDICVYSLLNLENGVVILRFVALGNAFLQQSMEMEPNWMLQKVYSPVVLVRLAMRILMLILRLKVNISELSGMSPLEALIYTQPKERDSLRIIHVVTSYMNNIFDRWLPILSCRLLKRIALEFDMSLLACLDMEPEQIRCAFLQKLPDEMENDSLKIAILELVESCIEKQPGITEAFFKVNSASSFFKNDIREMQGEHGILTYMEDYVEAVAKEPHIVQNPLPGKIMNLFHSLWKQNMQNLVEEIKGKEDFWEKLCSPLFSDLKSNVIAYMQILDIIANEIFWSPNNNSKTQLKKIVLKIFEEQYFKNWLNYVFDIPNQLQSGCCGKISTPEKPEWLYKLQVFKSFLFILLKKESQFVEISVDNLKILTEKCMQVLIDRTCFIADLRLFIIISEMYLLIIQGSKKYEIVNIVDENIFNQLTKLLNLIYSCYEDLPLRAKHACFAIIINIFNCSSHILHDNKVSALDFFKPVVEIICFELQYLENCAPNETETLRQTDTTTTNVSCSLILCLNLFKSLANIYNDRAEVGPYKCDFALINNKLIRHILSCICSLLHDYTKQSLCCELLDILIIFGKGKFSVEFLHCGIGDYLWLQLLPPQKLLPKHFPLHDHIQSHEPVDKWSIKDWWPIYSRGIELVTVILRQNYNMFLKDALIFIGMHEQYLTDSILLGKQTLETEAMPLIKNTMMLLCELVKFDNQWCLEHPKSFYNLLRAVKMQLGFSISILHQPNTLKNHLVQNSLKLKTGTIGEVTQSGEEIVSAINKLTELIVLCTKFLLRLSPNIIDLMCANQTLNSKWKTVLEIRFGALNFEDNINSLTLRTVLSVVGVLTKVLNLQNYRFHEVLMNTLPLDCQPQAEISPEFYKLSANTTADIISGGSIQRSYSKSLSTTSVVSYSCSTNELLYNIDRDLCLIALELVLTLSVSQSLLALRTSGLSAREKQLLRREISSELVTFHEFVRKKMFIDYKEHKDIWSRKKYGQISMQMTNYERSDRKSSVSNNVVQDYGDITSQNAMRINVVRRLHLQQQQRLSEGRSDFPGQSNSVTQTKSYRSHSPKKNKYSCEVIEQQEKSWINRSEYNPLSHIQLVEEDYLILISNLFAVICQND